MGTDDPLEKLHSCQLILADEVKRICEENNIRYFMISGTLLGAVRHHGFIPWDDDMDFGMLRLDYEKFLRVCEKELNSDKFYLQTDRKEKDYPFNFAKLTLKDTTVVESFSHAAKTHQGIYIDIFPLDVVSDDPIKKWIQFHVFYIAQNLLWVKSGYGTEQQQKKTKYKITKMIAALFPVKFLKTTKYISIARYAKIPGKYVVTSDGSYGLKKETLKREWVDTIKDYEFEDRVFPGIADCDAYLTYFYGDYMKTPPLDQQNHHERKKIDFGSY